MKVHLFLLQKAVLVRLAHVLEFRRNADDVLYEEKFVDEVRNRLITFKLVVSYGKHPFPNTAGDMILDITTENLKDPVSCVVFRKYHRTFLVKRFVYTSRNLSRFQCHLKSQE